ncbi:DNA-directed RNA polymerase subunit omega [Youxingia wuxianensis]|uniref:DNA-directed RNA polymerase subunit omega n=1 Tax=Youxingia wuxianensis TaxID=2763678 RepID=A0A926ELN4_9FIRM|nr:DNA-directed RNA polymerase subunit omega [Youxingia wuxianensis]MBC8585723.1 DNA-directed RNA polymerase subunit omega [Youxingia wuxianensis]
MLRPSLSSILKPGENYYTFVVAVAKRAREIAQEAEEQKLSLDTKPVKKAVEEFASGKYKLVNSVYVNSDTYR